MFLRLFFLFSPPDAYIAMRLVAPVLSGLGRSESVIEKSKSKARSSPVSFERIRSQWLLILMYLLSIFMVLVFITICGRSSESITKENNVGVPPL
uniref:Uncharacterized protein n=1 Tax=Trichogramma kaykai TaxID=54128 RepID=A0ABD2X4G7_9HYME